MFFLFAAISVLGFSADDKQVAYIETGESEGKGEPFAKLHVLDVAKSTDQVTSFDGEGCEKKAKDAAKGGWVAPKTLKPGEKGELTKPDGEPLGNLELKLKKAKGPPCDQAFENHSLALKLYLIGDDSPVNAGKAKPACRADCSIDSVYASHHKAALFLIRCSEPGFEGKSLVITPFTKKLEYGLDEDLPPQ